MSGQARLRLVDMDTGEVPGDGCPECQRWEMDYQLLLREKTALERKHLRERNRWKLDKEQERQKYARRADVEGRWAKYQELWGKHSSKLTADRFDLIQQALEWDYSPDILDLALEGHRARPYWTNYQWSPSGSPRDLHDKLSTVLKSGERIETFANIGYLERKARDV